MVPRVSWITGFRLIKVLLEEFIGFIRGNRAVSEWGDENKNKNLQGGGGSSVWLNGKSLVKANSKPDHETWGLILDLCLNMQLSRIGFWKLKNFQPRVRLNKIPWVGLVGRILKPLKFPVFSANFFNTRRKKCEKVLKLGKVFLQNFPS